MSFALSSNSASPFAPGDSRMYHLTSPNLMRGEKDVNVQFEQRNQHMTPVSHSVNQAACQENYYANYHGEYGTFEENEQESLPRTESIVKYRRKQPIPFSTDEDDFLTFLVKKYGHRNWKALAIELNSKFMCGRTPEQISQHWLRVVNPQITKGKWSREEDEKLIEACTKCQPKQWKEIANQLEGRSDIQVRYRLDRLKKGLLASGRISPEYLP